MKTAISQLGYLGIGVSDLRRWDGFARDILGMEAVEQGSDGTHFYRIDDHHHRLAVHPDGRDDIAYAGWQVADADELRDVAQRLESLGADISWADPAVTRDRKVSALFATRDPNGIPVEVYCGALMRREQPFNSPRGLAGFVAGDLGLGHMVLCVDDYEDSLRFYRDGLGLRTSDYIDMDIGATDPLSVAFLHAGPRHHSLALLKMDAPKRLHHFMLQVAHVDDVGTTYDLCRAKDISVTRSLGRHTNDRMFSFYMQSPSGFEVEFGHGGLLIDDDTWQVQRHEAPSIWGHQSS